MPLLAERGANHLLTAAAARAFHRSVERLSREDRPIPGDALENEIKGWVEVGHPPPPHMRMQDAQLFEEEASLAYIKLDGWAGLEHWREFGFFPEPPAFTIDPVTLRSSHQRPFPPMPTEFG